MPFNETETMENTQYISASIFVNLCYRHMHSCQPVVISFFVRYHILLEVSSICLELAEFVSYSPTLLCYVTLAYTDDSNFPVRYARSTGK
jgi:hypothetical protein